MFFFVMARPESKRPRQMFFLLVSKQRTKEGFEDVSPYGPFSFPGVYPLKPTISDPWSG
jgi:hypothetical protein